MDKKQLGIVIKAIADVKGDLAEVRKELKKTGRAGSKIAQDTSKSWDRELKAILKKLMIKNKQVRG